MRTNNKIPINRINKWFSDEDFNLEIDMSREAFEGDNNIVVVLYSVNPSETQYDDIYGESSINGLQYYPPVELRVTPIISEPENKVYNPNGTLRYKQEGKLSFYIYEKQLTELNIDIKFGDYIGYIIDENNMKFYSVVDDGLNNYDNEHTIMGYKSVYRTINCVPTDENEFKGI